jgi:hypothetical protein
VGWALCIKARERAFFNVGSKVYENYLAPFTRAGRTPQPLQRHQRAGVQGSSQVSIYCACRRARAPGPATAAPGVCPTQSSVCVYKQLKGIRIVAKSVETRKAAAEARGAASTVRLRGAARRATTSGTAVPAPLRCSTPRAWCAAGCTCDRDRADKNRVTAPRDLTLTTLSSLQHTRRASAGWHAVVTRTAARRYANLLYLARERCACDAEG